MKYEVLIYAGKEVLAALDVDGENMQYISMDGNQTHPADDVSGFYENLLDYFNVDDLSELKAGVRIINGGTSKKNIEFFNKKFIKVDDFSLWRAEELLPITALQKSMIERNESIAVCLYDRCYSITADSSFNISVEDTDEADKVMVLEDFTLMNNFNGSNFHSNSDEVKNLKIKVYESEHIIKDMALKIRESEQKIFSLSEIVTDLKTKVSELMAECNYMAGKVIQFGNYNEKPISWRILKRTAGSLYLLSEDILFDKVFESSTNGFWHRSHLRVWLNEEFYNSSFNDEERGRIEKVDNDFVTLITTEEVEELITGNIREKEKEWWLRTSGGGMAYSVYSVDTDGKISCTDCRRTLGVRPSLYLRY